MKMTRLMLATLLGGATAVVVGCRDPAPTGVDDHEPAPLADLVGGIALPTGLLWCSPLPYDSVTQTIGTEGGMLLVGPHTLSVPPGALDEPIRITAVAPSDTVNQVRFQPGGLTFALTANLTMSYANCDLLGRTLPKRIAYTSDLFEILTYLKSVDNPPSRTITGRLDHFSTYAVAW
jgi:hypothetical protein